MTVRTERLRVGVRFQDKQQGPIDVATLDRSTTWLRQVHGPRVVVVDHERSHCGEEADAAVTSCVDTRLLIRTADCAPILLTGEHDGEVTSVGVVHAGWKGLLTGIVAATVGALHGLGARQIRASLFPCIGTCCYEFREPELNAMVAALGESVRGQTSNGAAALDMVESVRASLLLSGVAQLDVSSWSCTACNGDRFFSFRARRESGRLGLFAWLESTSSTRQCDP